MRSGESVVNVLYNALRYVLVLDGIPFTVIFQLIIRYSHEYKEYWSAVSMISAVYIDSIVTYISVLPHSGHTQYDFTIYIYQML
jgi:hypothetical protein